MSPPDRPRVALFVGPSLAWADIRSAFGGIDAELQILPPAQQGDILRLLADLPDVIGIVDGYFFQVPALLHREILMALERGARVLGAASLGALRAAELDRFGMEGVGQIYQLYRRGVLDADDEVAVVHAPAADGFRPLTEALVTVRHNLRRARRRGIVSATVAAAALESARRLHFTERTYAAALDGARVGPAGRGEVAALRRFLRDKAVDLKREDTLRLVRTIARRLGGAEAWPPRGRSLFHQTTHLHRHQREYVGRSVEGLHVPDAQVVAFQQLLCPRFPRLYRRVAMRCLKVDEALDRGLVADPAEVLLAEFFREEGLMSEGDRAAWLGERCLSAGELAAALRDRQLEARLLALYRSVHPARSRRAALERQIARDVAARHRMREPLGLPLWMRPGVPWSDPLTRELKLRGAFRAALDLASRILRHNTAFFERHPTLERSRVRRGLLEEHFVGRWDVAVADLREAIVARGFAGYGQFLEAARHVFVYERSTCPSRTAEDPHDWFHADV
jgi:hypothetical protein